MKKNEAELKWHLFKMTQQLQYFYNPWVNHKVTPTPEDVNNKQCNEL